MLSSIEKRRNTKENVGASRKEYGFCCRHDLRGLFYNSWPLRCTSKRKSISGFPPKTDPANIPAMDVHQSHSEDWCICRDGLGLRHRRLQDIPLPWTLWFLALLQISPACRRNPHGGSGQLWVRANKGNARVYSYYDFVDIQGMDSLDRGKEWGRIMGRVRVDMKDTLQLLLHTLRCLECGLMSSLATWKCEMKWLEFRDEHWMMSLISKAPSRPSLQRLGEQVLPIISRLHPLKRSVSYRNLLPLYLITHILGIASSSIKIKMIPIAVPFTVWLWHGFKFLASSRKTCCVIELNVSRQQWSVLKHYVFGFAEKKDGMETAIFAWIVLWKQRGTGQGRR